MYYCLLKNDYFVAGVASSETPFADNITEEDKNSIVSTLCNKPTAPEGYEYRLRADDLEWELVELPPVEEPELTADEALDIILGGGAE